MLLPPPVGRKEFGRQAVENNELEEESDDPGNDEG
jgi:hypothetical protein